MGMQIHLSKFKFPFLLLIVCFIAYLPLSSFLFALKNDAFAYNFPNKYFFSEALQNGYLPVWNPYLNYGFPLYADPGFAWWHPITWLFGIIGYDVYTFTVEVLMYIYIAGLGMYWLGKKLNLSPLTSFIIGCMFMCSGFFIGNLQHINFITCAAFLPWLVGTWLKYQAHFNIKNALLFGIAAYLLCTGGHPAIPVATVFFFLLLSILYYFYFTSPAGSKIFIANQFKLLALTLVLLLPILLSYLQIIPYYSRTGPVDHATSANTGFTLPSLISFLYPFATIKNYNFFMTDVSMRNIYFTIPGFLFFVVFLFNKHKQKIQYIFFISGLIMLILSMGGVIKEIIYNHLPLFSWIKTNGEFRVFVIFSFLLCAAFELERSFSIKYSKFIFRNLLTVVLLISIFLFILFLFLIPGFNVFLDQESLTNTLKHFLDSISFKQSLLVSFAIATLLAACYLFSLKNSKKIFITILLADVVLSSWLLLPVTGVGKTSVSNIQNVINKMPNGFPSPITTKDKFDLSEEEEKWIVDVKWYNKKINHIPIDYPSQLKSTSDFFNRRNKNIFSEQPIIFLKNNTHALYLKKFTPTSFQVHLDSSVTDTLILLQNYFTGWEAKQKDKKLDIIYYDSTFISVPVQEKGSIFFSFKPFKF